MDEVYAWPKRDMCVCVCQPLGQGFPTATSTQGATAPFISLWPTKLLMFGEDMNLGRQVHVPATGLNCCPRCSNLSCLFPWWFHDTSPKHFPTAELQPRADRLRVHFNRMFNNTLLRTHAPCRSFTFLLNVGTELTEYNCQSVFRSAVPLGC